jgi:hypothetical protein
LCAAIPPDAIGCDKVDINYSLNFASIFILVLWSGWWWVVGRKSLKRTLQAHKSAAHSVNDLKPAISLAKKAFKADFRFAFWDHVDVELYNFMDDEAI